MPNLKFDANAFEDLKCWVEHDRKMALRVIMLISEVQSTPFTGAVQPERLKSEGAGSKKNEKWVVTLLGDCASLVP